MTQPNLNPCDEPGPIKDIRIDEVQPNCGREPSFKNVADREMSWLLDEMPNKKTGYGQSALGDPMQTGHIINEQGMSAPNRTHLYRYAKSLRGADEAMQDLFRDIVVLDEEGKAHNVPIMYGTQEKAVAFILQENTRKDNSLVVDRIKLPILAICCKNYEFDRKRYTFHKATDYLRTYSRDWKPGFTNQEKFQRDTVFGVSNGLPIDAHYSLVIWTMYEHDMKQIIEQVLAKFSPIAYIRVRGVAWEIGVELGSITNNGDNEPGDKEIGVKKYNVEMVAKTYLLQPIVRKKAVLKTQIDVTDSIEDENIGDIITRLEKTVEELEE